MNTMKYYWKVFCRASQCTDAEGYADTLERAKAAAEVALTSDMLAATKRYTLYVESPNGADFWKLTYGDPEGWVKA